MYKTKVIIIKITKKKKKKQTDRYVFNMLECE